MTDSNVSELRDDEYAADPRNLPAPTEFFSAEDLRIRWRFKSKDPVWARVREGVLDPPDKFGNNHSLWTREKVERAEQRIFAKSKETPIAEFSRKARKRG